jgi:hypothetical protein
MPEACCPLPLISQLGGPPACVRQQPRQQREPQQAWPSGQPPSSSGPTARPHSSTLQHPAPATTTAALRLRRARQRGRRRRRRRSTLAPPPMPAAAAATAACAPWMSCPPASARSSPSATSMPSRTSAGPPSLRARSMSSLQHPPEEVRVRQHPLVLACRLPPAACRLPPAACRFKR